MLRGGHASTDRTLAPPWPPAAPRVSLVPPCKLAHPQGPSLTQRNAVRGSDRGKSVGRAAIATAGATSPAIRQEAWAEATGGGGFVPCVLAASKASIIDQALHRQTNVQRGRGLRSARALRAHSAKSAAKCSTYSRSKWLETTASCLFLQDVMGTNPDPASS